MRISDWSSDVCSSDLLLDIAFDPLIGGVMDRTRTRIGRYRPWLLAGAPMVMLAMGMLFMASPGVGPWHLAIWLVLAYAGWRSEEHTSELQSLMRISYAVFCLKKKKNITDRKQH